MKNEDLLVCIIHQVCEELSEKHDIAVEVITEIIDDYDALMAFRLKPAIIVHCN